jgi:Ca-activated chloride channel family protein
MRYRPMLLSAALVILAAFRVHAQPWTEQPSRPAFRVGVDVVSLNVTVTDGTHHYVGDLAASDFTILEDGVRQKVTYFHKPDLPLAVALLIDTSASMEDKLAMAQAAATGFAHQLAPADVASVIGFDSRVTILQEFTSDATALERAIRRTRAQGSTSMYNAAYIALRELSKRSKDDRIGPDRRRAIVLVSDGEDTSSLLPLDDVLDLATQTGTTIYTIGIRAPGVPARATAHDGEFALRQLAQRTGGRAFFPLALGDLAGVYQDIQQELSNQYALAYVSTNPRRDGHWRTISVRISRGDAVARTKQGYYASGLNER